MLGISPSSFWFSKRKGESCKEPVGEEQGLSQEATVVSSFRKKAGNYISVEVQNEQNLESKKLESCQNWKVQQR